MDSRALEQTKQALDATRQMLSLIHSKKADTDLMHALLEKGADLRFVDSEAAQSGRTFADEMRSAGNDTLLEALRAVQGNRDLEQHSDPGGMN